MESQALPTCVLYDLASFSTPEEIFTSTAIGLAGRYADSGFSEFCPGTGHCNRRVLQMKVVEVKQATVLEA